ncbi:uncharacterized protein EI90DRAFT_3153875 [Cantharellus anzutake]|uniref:uncharacterized protein n=1 Tax=Cantharellus anzutake TaxID=1750568 RepID=UPI001903B175|nr:uncharacterized protein EI90DRAFT_3153875 [Cantharellus anzutake]KAF8333132.1 hypothetical protein EI90DRAFT_3153875 [Cantharellus anzutake]
MSSRSSSPDFEVYNERNLAPNAHDLNQDHIPTLSSVGDEEHQLGLGPSHHAGASRKYDPDPMDPFNNGELTLMGLSSIAVLLLTCAAVYVTVVKLQL